MSYRTNFTMDDDDDWQEMPVVRERSPASSPSSSDTEGAPSGYGRPGASIASASTSSFGSQQKRAQKKVGFGSTATATKASASSPAKSLRTNAAANAASATTASQRGHRRNLSSQTNATGRQLDIDDARGFSWRAKPAGLGEGGGRRRIDRLPEDKDADENEAAQGGRRRRLKPGDSSGSSSDDDNDDDDDEGGARGYTQLRLDDDVEGEEIDAATEYLFGQGHTAEDIASGEAPGATPHSQLDTTKNLLSEGQKIAYVGLVSLVARDLIRLLQRVPGKELKPAIDSADEWRLRVMARLFQHMDIESSEQSMIHSLAQHGVLPTDLAPSLVTTQTVDNPDFDPEAERERDEEREQQEQLDAERKEKEGQEKETTDEERGEGEVQEGEREEGERAREGPSHDKEKIESEEGEGADTGKAEKEALDETEAEEQRREESEGAATARLEGEAAGDLGDPFADEHAGGDLGSSGDADVKREIVETDAGQSLSADIANEEGSGDLGTDASTPTLAAGPSTPTIPDSKRVDPEEKDAFSAAAASAGSDRTEEKRSSRIIADPNTTTRVLGSAAADDIVDKTTPMGLTNQPQTIDTLPSALEGVTTELSSADRKITLDLRWTVLCDLFLVLTADSVYDSRSRVLLEKVAEHLGLAWMDVTKFEKRVTDALEIEEGVAGSLRGKKAVKKRAEAARRRRLVMMGLATVGGGLVIGLSAGLMAPFIGAGLGAALGTIGVGGTTGFLGGVGGAAIITTTGTVGGAALGGRGMSRRTRSVKTFEFKPIHNNKRVNCIVTVGGFMSGPQDDPRLPFSVVDSIMGDVFSVLWEPEMMQEMGDAIYLLWNETIVQGLQQVLAATIAGGLVGALAWPLWLTKLGYFIDNPWSNALDRAHACGLILADVLSRRQLGVRPITLVGFSLGARAIFYCLVELAQKKKFGIVQNVYLMGAPVTASDKTWKEARAVVAGRFVNAFSRTDWILGYLFRATTGGLRSIAGLHPVERVPEVENIDVTQTVPGHLQYRAFMPLVLDELGFRTTADYFDEPEDLSKVPEREIVYEQEEPEAVKEMKAVKTSSGGFGQIFKRKKTADGQGTSSGSSSNNSSTDHGAGPSIKSPTSPAPPSKLATQVSGGDGDDDDDDLPPREEHSPSYPVEEPKTPTLSQPAVPNKPASNMPPQSGASSGDADLDAILAELRESGIEVKELQSSLPPLPLAKPTTPSGSQTPSKDVSVSTGKQSKEQQEASSSLEPPSTAATKANLPRMQNQQQAQTLSPSSPALDGPSTAGEDKQPSSRPRLPYAKSFGSTVFDVDELPPPPPYSSASFSDSQDVSLSFGSSYDDDYEDEQRTSKGSPPPRVIVNEEEEKDKGEAELERIASGSAYGLSEETARELARQFQSSGMSTQGARAAAKMAQTLGQGSSDYSPAAPTAASPALDPWSSGGAGAGDGEDEEAAASAVASSGFAPLSAPERSFSFGRQTDDEAFSSASAESRYGGKGRGGLDLQPQQDPWGAAPNSAYGSSSSSAAHTPATGGMESNPWG